MMNNEHPMNSANPLPAFAPLIGQLVWAVSKGYDTFVTMEFGAPHLLVREPRAPRRNASPRLERTAARRSAIVKGDWHLFIEFAEWRMTSANGSIGSRDKKRASWQAVLDDISGQRLIVAESPTPGSLTLRFDLGGVAEIWPHPEIDNDVWTLHPWVGNIIGCRHDGTIETGGQRKLP